MRKLHELSRYEVYIIAKDYATTSQAVSGGYLSQKYQITSATFYNVLHKAILERIVSETVAKMIAAKAATNNYNHGGEGARIRTLEMYEDLIRNSKKHRLGRSDAKYWTIKYIESELELENFAKANYIDEILLKRAFYDTVVNCWIDDKEVELLKVKTKNHKEKDIEEAFEKMLEKRDETSKKVKK